MVRLLGPLSIIKELDDDLWCTMVLLPRSSTEVQVRADLYAKEGHVASAKASEKWKWMLNQELLNKLRSDVDEKSSKGSNYFAYQCGGKSRLNKPFCEVAIDSCRSNDRFICHSRSASTD